MGYLNINWRIILKLTAKYKNMRQWTGFIWHRIGTSGMAFLNMVMNRWVHTRHGIS
jgi:hypothetical protein